MSNEDFWTITAKKVIAESVDLDLQPENFRFSLLHVIHHMADQGDMGAINYLRKHSVKCNHLKMITFH